MKRNRRDGGEGGVGGWKRGKGGGEAGGGGEGSKTLGLKNKETDIVEQVARQDTLETLVWDGE